MSPLRIWVRVAPPIAEIEDFFFQLDTELAPDGGFGLVGEFANGEGLCSADVDDEIGVSPGDHGSLMSRAWQSSLLDEKAGRNDARLTEFIGESLETRGKGLVVHVLEETARARRGWLFGDSLTLIVARLVIDCLRYTFRQSEANAKEYDQLT